MLPRVRIELTTFRSLWRLCLWLWDWRATYCATEAAKKTCIRKIWFLSVEWNRSFGNFITAICARRRSLGVCTKHKTVQNAKLRLFIHVVELTIMYRKDLPRVRIELTTFRLLSALIHYETDALPTALPRPLNQLGLFWNKWYHFGSIGWCGCYCEDIMGSCGVVVITSA